MQNLYHTILKHLTISTILLLLCSTSYALAYNNTAGYNNYKITISIPAGESYDNYSQYIKRMELAFYKKSAVCSNQTPVDQNPNIITNSYSQASLSPQVEFPGNEFAQFIEHNTYEPAPRFDCFKMIFVVQKQPAGPSVVVESTPVKFTVKENSKEQYVVFSTDNTNIDMP